LDDDDDDDDDDDLDIIINRAKLVAIGEDDLFILGHFKKELTS